jgi:hypothetical protein
MGAAEDKHAPGGLDSKSIAGSTEQIEGFSPVATLGELSYGPAGVRGIFSSSYVAFCAAFATIGGLLFGYE